MRNTDYQIRKRIRKGWVSSPWLIFNNQEKYGLMQEDVLECWRRKSQERGWQCYLRDYRVTDETCYFIYSM